MNEEQKLEQIVKQLSIDSGKSSRVLYRFAYLAKCNKQHKLIEKEDMEIYESTMKTLSITNVCLFLGNVALFGGFYWKFRGFKVNPKRPFLSKLKHSVFICLPSLILVPIALPYFQKEKIANLNQIAFKYKTRMFDPEFNKRLVEGQRDAYKEYSKTYNLES